MSEPQRIVQRSMSSGGSECGCQREGEREAERLLRRVSLRTSKLRRQMIGWIRVGILEDGETSIWSGNPVGVMSRGA